MPWASPHKMPHGSGSPQFPFSLHRCSLPLSDGTEGTNLSVPAPSTQLCMLVRWVRIDFLVSKNLLSYSDLGLDYYVTL